MESFSSCSRLFQTKRDRWDLNPRSSGLAAISVGARCPILVVLASGVADRMRSRLRSLILVELCPDKKLVFTLGSK